jgi:hypothetical protein
MLLYISCSIPTMDPDRTHYLSLSMYIYCCALQEGEVFVKSSSVLTLWDGCISGCIYDV